MEQLIFYLFLWIAAKYFGFCDMGEIIGKRSMTTKEYVRVDTWCHLKTFIEDAIDEGDSSFP